MRYQRNLFAERCRDDVQLLCGEQLQLRTSSSGTRSARTGIDNPPDYCHPFLAGVSTAPGRCPVQAGKSVRLVAPVRIKIVHRGIRLVLKDPVRSSARCPADDKHAAAVDVDPDRISLIGGGFTGRADVLDGRTAACAADSPWPPPVIYALRRPQPPADSEWAVRPTPGAPDRAARPLPSDSGQADTEFTAPPPWRKNPLTVTG